MKGIIINLIYYLENAYHHVQKTQFLLILKLQSHQKRLKLVKLLKMTMLIAQFQMILILLISSLIKKMTAKKIKMKVHQPLLCN
jgi:hypothetical protein